MKKKRQHSWYHFNLHKSVLYKNETVLLPIVGIVVTISPNFNLYNIVVLPAASNPTIKILISFDPTSPRNSLSKKLPISGIEQACCNTHTHHKLVNNLSKRQTHNVKHHCFHVNSQVAQDLKTAS